MRLWHYKLIPYLPRLQLLSQWKELNSIFKNQPKHILINYVYEYPKYDLLLYSVLVIEEMKKRNFKIKSFDNFDLYFKDYMIDVGELYDPPFKNHHTDRYLIQCFYNLEEKYDRGQKDFTKEIHEKLCKFVKEYYCMVKENNFKLGQLKIEMKNYCKGDKYNGYIF